MDSTGLRQRRPGSPLLTGMRRLAPKTRARFGGDSPEAEGETEYGARSFDEESLNGAARSSATLVTGDFKSEPVRRTDGTNQKGGSSDGNGRPGIGSQRRDADVDWTALRSRVAKLSNSGPASGRRSSEDAKNGTGSKGSANNGSVRTAPGARITDESDSDGDERETSGNVSGSNRSRGSSRSGGSSSSDSQPTASGSGSGESGESNGFRVDVKTLVPGDVLVHKKLGICRFTGTRLEVPQGRQKKVKYLLLQFADGTAKLSAKQAKQVLYRFGIAGPPGRSPPLSKMHDPNAWERRQAKGKEAVERMVVEMMDVYVKRLRQRRLVYPKFEEEMRRFGESFPYAPTPDQEQAFLDVERDMCERETPMDRLVCGDVGFGKTEVAVRAIFRAVLDKRQAMVLAPTTVLAKQHYKVISARLKEYGVRVALLSRFQKESEKKEVLAGIRDGTLDVVAGTHSLLGSQVVYHNLGLLVIDEEQRFGVRQKERISSLKTSVDVLTLSATPIPRTLYMSMHGFRDASRITTPPPERQPIATHLLEFDVEDVRRAIGEELDRGGQVFYVVPRVEGIEEIQMILEELFPSARIDVAHGKLRPTELEAAMERFGEGEVDVLLCTSIIESGIDIRTVNTIIIEDTHLFGLAQIYQLRGRVGRSNSSAHAYLFHPPLHCLTPEAQERLKALQQHSGLGEGYLLAQRDMDIRGIGDVFGERQSGDVGGVGYYLFMEMLHETLTKVEQKSLPRVRFEEVRLDLPLAPLPPIPASYVPEASLRASLPKEAEEAAAEGMPALLGFCREMRAEYGDEPAAVELLFKHLFVRRMAADLGIYRILQRDQGTTVVMETAMKLPAFEILRDAVQQKVLRESLAFRSGRIELQGTKALSPERVLERALTCLAQMRNALPSFVNFL
ncbi:hypothetical protein CLOM_g2643 [Closterium sp. NIES-68]|nr:hypothetical protein CLOM_g2643 [Closterium sp. NIES-68]GJP67520.1 hypothetical protein CLOP_g24333 [Closterium sp. NIES-67]